MIYASNMTAEEAFKLNGTLSTEQIESMLDKQASMPDMFYVTKDIEEGFSGFSAEDFLSDKVSLLTSLAGKMRGDNKKELLFIVEMINQDLQSQRGSVEYGREKLNQAIAAIKGE